MRARIRLVTDGGIKRGVGAAVSITAVLSLLAIASPSAQAAVEVSHFSVTPSTTQAAGHPNLRVAIRFTEPTTGLKDAVLQLPKGVGFNPRAIPFCSRKRLLADLCPSKSKVGTVTVVGLVWGFELAVTRRIYNLRPSPSESVRVGVSVFGSLSRPGVAIELPLTKRPDGGLDMAVREIPREVNGVAIRVKEIAFWFRGVARVRVRNRVRTTAYLTNPASCEPARSVLEVRSHDAGAQPVVRTSAFTPTGCGAS